MRTKPQTTDLATLEAEATAAADRHAAAVAAADAARQAAEEVRAERLLAYDRKLLDAFSEEALEADVRDAQRALDDAVAECGLGRAWSELKKAQRRRSHLAGEAAAAAQRVGDTRRITPRVADSAIPDELTRAVDRVADRGFADEVDAREDARNAAGDG